MKCDLPVEKGAQSLNENPASGEGKDLRRYEIYYKDDYDYLKHLKARDDLIWEDEGMELSIASKPDLQVCLLGTAVEFEQVKLVAIDD